LALRLLCGPAVDLFWVFRHLGAHRATHEHL
jgi:hypothetical protein